MDFAKITANEIGLYGLIYCITNKVNNKKYIGLTTESAYARWLCHSTSKSNHISLLKRSIDKYGKENFIIDILGGAYSYHELGELEDYYINLYNTLDSNFGYNLRSGGNQNFKHHESTKNKISQTKKDNPYIPTKEYRKKLSNSLKGKSKSKEHNLKVGLANKGRKFSKEFLNKMTKHRIENYGKKVELINMETNEKLIFDSIGELSRYLNYSKQRIRNSIKYGYTMNKIYKVGEI